MTDFYAGIEGKIIYLDPKGWGFITTPIIEFEKIYFHWSSLKDINFKELRKGNRVKFNALKRERDEQKKWKAINVEVLENE